MGKQLAADLAVSLPAAMTVDQFCRLYCIGKTKAYAEAKAGRLTLRKIGAKTVVLRSDADIWLKQLPTAP